MTSTMWRVVALIGTTLLAACSSGPSESEFVAACHAEGQRGANRALSRELGVDRDKFCPCAAKEAKSLVSADGYRWLMLDMAGKRQEAQGVEAKMSESDRMDLMKASVAVFGKCAAGRR
jgi:hypothetical protein